MRYPASEKLEIIRLVEQSHLSARRTLQKLGRPHATFDVRRLLAEGFPESKQVPLMIITFMPALGGLKQQWAEANATLGGTRLTYWTRIGFPVLAPSFLASLLLLFANAFSSYATAAALVSQGSPLVPLQIRAKESILEPAE